MHYDIAIIGAGPAGSTLARLVSNKYKIALIDGQSHSHPKPCGGLLSPHAQKAFASLNITLPSAVLADPQIFSVKTIDVCSGLIRSYQRFYINMDRYAFDKWMISIVPNTVNIISGKVISVANINNAYLLKIKSGNTTKNITCDILVGADGANSIVRRTFYPKYNVKNYIAIQQYFTAKASDPFYSCIFDRKTSPACSWSIVKGDKLIFGGAFEPEQCKNNFQLQKKRLKKYNFDLSSPIKTEACRVVRPTLKSGFCTGKNNVYLVGEAAGFISPSSFEGIGNAIKSASLLAEALNSDAKNVAKTYAAKTFLLKVRLYIKCIKRFLLYTPITRFAIMLSGIKSIHQSK